MKKIGKFLFSPVTMVILLIMASFFMGMATFIENDFGPQASRDAIYNAWWFEVLLLLLAINFTGAIFERKMYKRRKWPVLLVHVGFIIILLGAAITRYFGYEGTMHIREGASSSEILLNKKAIKIGFTSPNNYQFTYDFNLKKDNEFEETLKHNGQEYDVKLIKKYPAAIEKAIKAKNGKPVIGYILAGQQYRGFSYIEEGKTRDYGGFIVAFGTQKDTADIYFSYAQDTFYIEAKNVLAKAQMGDQKQRKLIRGPVKLEQKKLYQTMGINIVAQEMYTSARITAVPTQVKNHSASRGALIFTVANQNQMKEAVIWQSNTPDGNATSVTLNNEQIHMAYGQKTMQIPFKIHLNDFVIERYPGSQSPSSFSSHVTIKKEGKEPMPYHIYMNNILAMDGFRFYQSSYDNDEKGTILSVNHDSAGTAVTYIGYFILTLGLILTLFSKHTFLWNTKIKKAAGVTIAILLLMTLPNTNIFAQKEHNHEKHQFVSQKHAEKFGKILVQGRQGRTKPLNTLASDMVRKISRSSSVAGLTPTQFFLELHLNPQYWVRVPFIKVGNDGVKKLLGITSDYAAYTDIVAQGKGYKLSGMTEKIYAKSPANRNKMDKEIIKVDERVNICYGIFANRYMNIFPVQDTTIEKWQSPSDAPKFMTNKEDSAFVASVIPVYYKTVREAKKTGNYDQANEIIEGIRLFQKQNARYELPSKTHVELETIYYKWNIFKKLFPFYATIGLLYLFILVASIISGKKLNKWLNRGFMAVILFGFLAHTAGLAIRWYISGHAPMSNGYESMIFVAWVTILAGFAFNKYSPFALAATAVLGGFTLMVANLSFMDPQITNLVPVLKSYWLTLHVSIITGSYGFLGLGAILGIINLILFSLKTRINFKRIDETLAELTVINHKSLTLGLIFLTIGTFLGAVWANESWGRYWGWDPKETWSLITILIYTIVTHARLVPNMKGIFIFNILGVYAFFSVLMTYFGVNYYLSGLHSYAGGDPVPIPTFVYISIGILILLSMIAWVNEKNVKTLVNKQ